MGPIGDQGPSHPCWGGRIEYGTYSWNGAARTLTVTGVSIDTNGCAGVNEPPKTGGLFQGVHSIKGITLLANARRAAAQV